MNQEKLEVVKQDMARVNINILGISKLKWTGMGEINSDDHYIYYCGQGFLRRSGVAITVNKKEYKMQYLDAILKMTKLSRECMFLSFLSHHNKDLEQRTLKPSVRHSSRVLDKPCYSSQANQCYSSILFRR